MTVLADEQEALLRPILPGRMPTTRAGLRGVVGIHLDGHAFIHEGFVGNQSVQLRKGPPGLCCIGFALLLRRLFAMLAFGALTNVCQVLQADETVGVLLDDAPTHDMVTIRFQPSLSPTDPYEATPGVASAFALQPFLEPSIMVRFLDDVFARIERTRAGGGAGHGQIAHADINTNDLCMRLGCWVCDLDLKAHEQVELLAWFVIPQPGCSKLSPVLNESHVFGIASVGHNHPSLQREDADPGICLEAVVLALLIRQGGRHILGRLIQSFVALHSRACLACSVILLDFGPQGFVGG